MLCKLCGNSCEYNSKFTRFLALQDTPCQVYSCRNCKTAFLVGDIPQDIYEEGYFSNLGTEYSYEQQSRSNFNHYRDISKKLAALSKGRETLADVGCGLGHFMFVASRDFKEVQGFDGFVDPEKFVCEPEHLVICDIDHVTFKRSFYDAITLNHSLEHVDDPIYILKQVHAGLKDDGVLYVEVPLQFYSFYDRLKGLLKPKSSPDFLSFHHKTFFSPSSLIYALEKEGFKVLEFTTFLPRRGLGRFRGIRGVFLYLFLAVSSAFNRGDYISVFAKKVR